MLYFENDYSEGCCPEVLEALVNTNLQPLTPYGSDVYTLQAKQKICAACGCPDGDVYLLVGGTQTNKTVIDAVLKKYEGVVAADTGHIAQHEAGAIESAGHKVLTVPHEDGKLPAVALRALLHTFYDDANHDHMVFPGMVYISHPTEFGTLYTKAELEALAAICREYDIPLFLDGARLGYGLAAGELTLQDIATLCDVFYIGGTKVGALCGEAVVFPKGNAPKQFITTVKQNGALLAKGRLLGVQFDRLFTDGLYEKISENAILLANKLKKALREKGYRFFIDSPTNQIFVILNNAFMEKLGEQVRFSFWQRYDEDHTVIRFATSWATREEDVDALIELL